MSSYLACCNPQCGARYAIDDVVYRCSRCQSLLEVAYEHRELNAVSLKQCWRERRTSNETIDRSGVWRYRELLPFADAREQAVTLYEGNTPLFDSPSAARYGGLESIRFKHQGFNPSGSFKDNGMTCGVTQARRLGRTRVACVSTGNTSASLAAYAAAAGFTAIIFLPQGNIALGKLAQALDYGAVTIQIEANFDEILLLIREVAEPAGLYLLNSLNPFRIEGQKTIAIELLDQLDWQVPDWIVLPGGNLGNTAAFGKGFLELHALRFIDRLPRIAVIQAEGAAPLYRWMRVQPRGLFEPVRHPQTLATAIRIGDPVSWPKAEAVLEATAGVVEAVTEEEIADAKAVIGRAGIGCEPASATTLAGVKRLTAQGVMRPDAQVVAILTGHQLKDPDYILGYHASGLRTPGGESIRLQFPNPPLTVSKDPAELLQLLAAY